jgi:site-specific recombinase XerD
MERLLVSCYPGKLSFLQATSKSQVLSYLSLLQARNYASGTLDAVVTIMKRFSRHVPAPRQSILNRNLAQTTVQDIDGFISTASSQGLAPATINTTLSVLKAFFDFLHEDGQMQSQPILRHRHRLMAPSLEVLKELMGHRSIHITLRYTQLYDATKRHQYNQAMERIERRQAGLGR